MCQQQPQRDAGPGEQCRAYGGMAMEIDIDIEGGGEFGTNHPWPVCIALPCCLLPGFPAAEIALMDDGLAIGAQIHIDAPALALGRLLIFPGRKMLVDGYDHHIAPARIEPRPPARGARSEERRIGTEVVRTGKYRGSPD